MRNTTAQITRTAADPRNGRPATASAARLHTVPAAAFSHQPWPAVLGKALPDGPFDVRIVLSDGTVAIVDDVHDGAIDTIALTVFAVDQIEVSDPQPVQYAGEVYPPIARSGEYLTRRLITMPADALITLAPGCRACHTTPGVPCAYTCPTAN